MFKIRIPYSGVLALIVGLALSISCSELLWVAGIIGAVCEIVIAIILYKKLCSESEFEYDSFIGHLLVQYTGNAEIGLNDLLNLIGARVASYVLLSLIVGAPSLFGLEISLWFLIVPAILYLLTVIYVKA